MSFTDSQERRGNKEESNRLFAVRMLERKYGKKAELKEKELILKSEELQLQNKKFEQEAAERKEAETRTRRKEDVCPDPNGKDVELLY